MSQPKGIQTSSPKWQTRASFAQRQKPPGSTSPFSQVVSSMHPMSREGRRPRQQQKLAELCHGNSCNTLRPGLSSKGSFCQRDATMHRKVHACTSVHAVGTHREEKWSSSPQVAHSAAATRANLSRCAQHHSIAWDACRLLPEVCKTSDSTASNPQHSPKSSKGCLTQAG